MWEIVTILFTDRWKVMGDVRNSDDTHSLLRDKTYCERWEIVTILTLLSNENVEVCEENYHNSELIVCV